MLEIGRFLNMEYANIGIEAGHLATGFAKVVGNKGATAIGLELKSLTLLFICSHFAGEYRI